MKEMITLECGYCASAFKKDLAEVRRHWKKGRETFYCSISCGAKAGNAHKKNRCIEKTCPVCKVSFAATTGAKEATFCSRSCASKGSVTKYRREKAACIP